MKHQGNLVIRTANDAEKYKGVVEVTGDVDIYSDASLPNLQTVGGDVDIRNDASLPNLQTVGGYVGIYGDASFEVPNAKFNQNMFDPFMDQGYVYADGILTELVYKKKFGKKGALYVTKRIGLDETVYVLHDGQNFAHGKTIKGAKSDLLYKSMDRDLSAYKNMPLSTSKTPYEWAAIYRVITAACSTGAEMFIEGQGELKEQYTLAEIIEATKGAYGSDTFVQTVRGEA